MPFRENKQECREWQRKTIGEAGLSFAEMEEENGWGWALTQALQFQGQIEASPSLPEGMGISQHKTRTVLAIAPSEKTEYENKHCPGLKNQLCPNQQGHYKVLSHVPQATTSSHRPATR